MRVKKRPIVHIITHYPHMRKVPGDNYGHDYCALGCAKCENRKQFDIQSGKLLKWGKEFGRDQLKHGMATI